MALQNWPNSARTRAVLCWVVLSAPIRVGSTRCMVRYTVTDVAWFTKAQPTAADDVTGADEVAGAPAGFEAAAVPQPASAEHSSTASTVPRAWRGDIMHLGRTPRLISSLAAVKARPPR